MPDSNFHNRTWLGIDFGTVLSKAAVLPSYSKSPSLIRMDGRFSDFECPTIVFVDPNSSELLVGQAALLRGSSTPQNLFDRFKLKIGQQQYITIPGISEKFRWQDLVAAVLRYLKQSAETRNHQGRPIYSAIITVPAIYIEGGVEWKLMEAAARQIGLEEIIIVREPEAAAAYVNHVLGEGKFIKNEEICLVYDLGGGTFDPGLLQKQGGRYKILGQHSTPEGIRAGGIFIDEKIAKDVKNKCPKLTEQEQLILLDEWGRIPKDKEQQYRTQLKDRRLIQDFCQEIKHFFSDQPKAVSFQSPEPVLFQPYELTRADFYALITPMIDDTIECCRALVRKAKVEWKNISKIIMVGGSCHIPLVQEKLKTLCIEENAEDIIICWQTADGVQLDTLHAVALGAAVYLSQLPSAEELLSFGLQKLNQRNFLDAEYYLRQAIHYGSPDAAFYLGTFEYLGLGRKKSYKKAARFFSQAGDQHHDRSIFMLGLMYLRGQGVQKNNEEALYYFKKIANIRGELFEITKTILSMWPFWNINNPKSGIGFDLFMSELEEVLLLFNLDDGDFEALDEDEHRETIELIFSDEFPEKILTP